MKACKILGGRVSRTNLVVFMAIIKVMNISMMIGLSRMWLERSKGVCR